MRYIEPRRLLNSLSLPILFTGIVAAVSLVWWIFQLPNGDELVSIVQRFFDTYGYWALFISSFIEGALVLGFYFPGGVVIFLSVVLAGHDVPRVATIVGLVSGAFVLGLVVDYLLGKYGWYKILVKFGFRRELENAQRRLQRHGVLAIILSYWDINIASMTATAAGILRYPFVRFVVYSAIFITIWNSFWATLIFFIGKGALRFTTGGGKYALILIAGWVVIIFIKHVFENWHREYVQKSSSRPEGAAEEIKV